MGLIELVVSIALVGVVVWVLVTFLPMPAEFKKAIVVVSILGLAIYILSIFGLFHGIKDIRIGR